MISSGRYRYHKEDIAELEARKQEFELGTVAEKMLETMKKEVAEYEVVHPTDNTSNTSTSD